MKQIESLFWGIIAAFGALFMQFIIYLLFSFFQSPSSIFFLQPGNIIFFAFIEEVMKYLIISKIITRFSASRALILNSLSMAVGFSIIEFGLLFTANSIPTTTVAFELLILHLGTAGIIGFVVSLKKKNSLWNIMAALITVTALHSAYNILILNRQQTESYAINAILAFLIAFNLANLIKLNPKLARE